MKWEVVIGLEVHVQLLTASKIFSASSTQFGARPNSQASLIDLGFPGTLPMLNEEVVNQAIKFGLAVDASINPHSVFERKNYFYPDLPKGYQLSQLESPIIIGGRVPAPIKNAPNNTVQLTRAHLEEDAGKSVHLSDESGIDLNRAGVPLLEIVTEPTIHSPEEALSYLKQLHALVQYLEICDGNMQEGSFRCDVNLSIRPQGEIKLGTRTEIKNVNSFRFIERAINYEVERHIEVLEAGGTLIQETRLYNEKQDKTLPMRSKEDANDYRYFPCPDLLPLLINQTQIDAIKKTLPELPLAKKARYMEQYHLTEEDAQRLTQQKNIASYFETVLAHSQAQPQRIANWIVVELLGYLNRHQLTINDSKVAPENLASLMNYIHNQTISGKIAKQVFQAMCATGETATAIIEAQNLSQMDDPSELKNMITELIQANPKQAQQYIEGKDKLLGFFVGQVMKQSQGKANPALVNQLLNEAFDKLR